MTCGRSFILVYLGLLLGMSPTAYAADKIVLTIGSIANKPSLPLDAINADSSLPFSLSPHLNARSEAMPWMAPLSSMLSELPDIVTVLAGYSYNDIPQLVDNNLLEPLDEVFKELDIDPQQYFLPNVYQALQYRGHIWAIPHRVQTYLLTIDTPTFVRLGIEPVLPTWEAVFSAARRVANEAVMNTKIPGFTEGEVPIEHSVALLIDFIERPGTQDGSASALSLFERVVADGVLDGSPGYASLAVRLETFSTLENRKEGTILPAPSTAAISAANSAGSLGFLECFALRKNSDLRLASAKAFVKWITSANAQNMLVEASRLDKPKSETSIAQRHVPVVRQALESDYFTQLCAQQPNYIALVTAQKQAVFCTPDQGKASRQTLEAYHGLFTYVLESKSIREVLDRFNTVLGFFSSTKAESSGNTPLSSSQHRGGY